MLLLTGISKQFHLVYVVLPTYIQDVESTTTWTCAACTDAIEGACAGNSGVTIGTSNSINYGDWQPWYTCPGGMAACGFQVNCLKSLGWSAAYYISVICLHGWGQVHIVLFVLKSTTYVWYASWYPCALNHDRPRSACKHCCWKLMRCVCVSRWFYLAGHLFILTSCNCIDMRIDRASVCPFKA